jgi:hypothetical protein
MMNKKLVSMAVAAALVGGVGAAQAIHVNTDGLGQVLLYPFYSVEGGNDTYIQIVNTTDQTKAVKVRFLEAMNSAGSAGLQPLPVAARPLVGIYWSGQHWSRGEAVDRRQQLHRADDPGDGRGFP